MSSLDQNKSSTCKWVTLPSERLIVNALCWLTAFGNLAQTGPNGKELRLLGSLLDSLVSVNARRVIKQNGFLLTRRGYSYTLLVSCIFHTSMVCVMKESSQKGF
jgi:hypothetical protein